MNTTQSRPSDVNAARIARKLRARGIDPTKHVAKPADGVATVPVPQVPSLAEQEAELERMLREECGDQNTAEPKTAPEAIIGDEAVTDAPVTEPESSEKENPSDTPILEVHAAEVPEETRKVEDYKPTPAAKPVSTKAVLSSDIEGIGVVVDETFAELMRKRGSEANRVVTLQVNDAASQKPVYFLIRGGPLLRHWKNLAGQWVLVQGMKSQGDGIRRFALKVKPRDVPVTGILRASRWPAQQNVTFEYVLAKNGTFHVNVTRLNAGLHVHVGKTEYVVADSIMTRVNGALPEEHDDEPEVPEASTLAELKQTLQPEKQALHTQPDNGDQRDRKVTPPQSFKAKAESKQAKRPKSKPHGSMDRLIKAFPELKALLPNISISTSCLHDDEEIYRTLAEVAKMKKHLTSERNRISAIVVMMIKALEEILMEQLLGLEVNDEHLSWTTAALELSLQHDDATNVALETLREQIKNAEQPETIN